MIAASILMLIPPPPIPGPPQPKQFPEYSATCHAIGVDEPSLEGTLSISGQEPDRIVELALPSSNGWPSTYKGSPQTFATHFVTDGTYRYLDYLTYKVGGDTYLVTIEGLGPSPDVLSLAIKRPPESPVFEKPGLVGLCRLVPVSESSPK